MADSILRGERAPKQKMQRAAIVVGGSVAGLFVGSLLHRDGWSVQVCERAGGSLESRGAGIGTHEDLFEAMRQCGAPVDKWIGIEVTGRAAYDRAGAEVARFDFPQYLTSWQLLYRRLRRTLPDACYLLDKLVTKVVDGNDRVQVHFADGSNAEADLLVGADGSWSTVRSLINPADAPGYCGYVAWRGMIEETALPIAFRARYGRFLNFFNRPDQQLIVYPVAGVDDSVEPGQRRFSFLWYRPYGAEKFAQLLTDADGVRHLHQIPPSRIDLRHIERMREEAAADLPPDFANFVRSVPQPFLQPIYDLSPSRIAFRRTVLAGDAACVARPHVGAGVAKAGKDAVALVDALRECDSLAAALKRYEAERMPFARALVEQGRYLGGYLEAPPGAPRAPMLPVDIIIRESANLLSLKASDQGIS